MITKAAALYRFFSGFGIPAYVSTSVPDDATFPRLTYEPVFGAFDFTRTTSGEMAMSVNLWYRTESEAIPNSKAEEISEAIGMGGKMLSCDGGFIWLKRGSPFCQPMADADDPAVKRRYINITIEYLTAN